MKTYDSVFWPISNEGNREEGGGEGVVGGCDGASRFAERKRDVSIRGLRGPSPHCAKTNAESKWTREYANQKFGNDQIMGGG